MNTATAGTLLLLLAVVSSGVAFAPAYAAHGDDPTVDIPDGVGVCGEGVDCYLPMDITVEVGTEITWTNNDILHTVSSGAFAAEDAGLLFDSGFTFNPGTTFTNTFEEAGEYPYHCKLHPNMTGVVTVIDAHAGDKDHMDDGMMMEDGMMDNMNGTMDDGMMMEDEMMKDDGMMMEDEMMKDDGMMMEDEMMKDDGMMMEDEMMKDDGMMMEDEMMKDDGMMMMGDAMMMTTQGGEIMVSVTSGDPTNGQPLDLQLKFTDAQGNAVEHVNYDVLVTQGNSRVHSASGIHAHMSNSLEMISTRSLESSEPVDVRVTFQGIGLPSTPVADRNGPVGEMIEFEDVPEFGTIAVMILIVSIISIVAVTARSNVFARV